MDKIKAYAKVNIRLETIGLLPNGYHDLAMVNCKVNFYDTLEISESRTNKVTFSNNKLNNIINNYCLFILNEMCETYNLPHQEIYIDKNIPDGAGLGGGSSDAAAIINYLDSKYKLNLTMDEKIKIGFKYGADIPYCLYDVACYVRGAGEIVTPINDYFSTDIFLIMPKYSISTREVFENCNTKTEPTDYKVIAKLFTTNYIEPLLYNDLEESAFKLMPNLKELKEKLNEYGKASMSGSGTTLFLVPSEEYTEEFIKSKFPYCRVVKTSFIH